MYNYSNSKCPHCQSSLFELVEETPSDSAFPLMFIRCSLCATVIGTTESTNIGWLIRKLAEKLNISLK